MPNAIIHAAEQHYRAPRSAPLQPQDRSDLPSQGSLLPALGLQLTHLGWHLDKFCQQTMRSRIRAKSRSEDPMAFAAIECSNRSSITRLASFPSRIYRRFLITNLSPKVISAAREQEGRERISLLC